LESFTVTQNEKFIYSEIHKKFRFKKHHQTGPGFHTDFKFSIDSRYSDNDTKLIEIKVLKNIRFTTGDDKDKIVEVDFDRLVEIPFEKGIQRFVDFLKNQELNISTDLQIEIFEYTCHPVDSKAIGNETGIFIALKIVFLEQLNIERGRGFIFEELE
jgi:hypothetical protein